MGRYGSDSGIDFDAVERALGREQALWLETIGMGEARGKKVADIGAGCGVFLDLVSPAASGVLGIELSDPMRAYLESKGHRVARSMKEIPAGSLDLCVSFDVLEHVLDPRDFLSDARRILCQGGKFFIGVPNQNDFLKEICGAYLKFFYHRSHLYYFSSIVLSNLLLSAGFEIADVKFVHKYNFMNMVNWLRDAKPTGVSCKGPFDSGFEADFRRSIESQGGASHILIEAINPG